MRNEATFQQLRADQDARSFPAVSLKPGRFWGAGWKTSWWLAAEVVRLTIYRMLKVTRDLIPHVDNQVWRLGKPVFSNFALGMHGKYRHRIIRMMKWAWARLAAALNKKILTGPFLSYAIGSLREIALDGRLLCFYRITGCKKNKKIATFTSIWMLSMNCIWQVKHIKCRREQLQ